MDSPTKAQWSAVQASWSSLIGVFNAEVSHIGRPAGSSSAGWNQILNECAKVDELLSAPLNAISLPVAHREGRSSAITPEKQMGHLIYDDLCEIRRALECTPDSQIEKARSHLASGAKRIRELLEL